ncbi:MAG: phosphatase PAP2 family protein [Nevskiaceae bacterium]|nr:MAG: phosphatase PAP2 family protein [Nevskiaceae bacterium]TBR71853.1 MAG: phosphatase PAP2 family protein [Nevskiaceae bacterium]
MIAKAWLVVVLFLAMACTLPVQARDIQTWKDVSTAGVVVLMGASLGVPAAGEDWQGLLQAGLSDASAEGIALLGKAVVHEERPNHADDKSFPSGHSTVAFAAATTLYRRYGWQYGFPAYGVATLVGAARVLADEHHWWDVAAGAAFGIGAGWLFTRPIDGQVQLTPWIGYRSGGVILSAQW